MVLELIRGEGESEKARDTMAKLIKAKALLPDPEGSLTARFATAEEEGVEIMEVVSTHSSPKKGKGKAERQSPILKPSGRRMAAGGTKPKGKGRATGPVNLQAGSRRGAKSRGNGHAPMARSSTRAVGTSRAAGGKAAAK